MDAVPFLLNVNGFPVSCFELATSSPRGSFLSHLSTSRLESREKREETRDAWEPHGVHRRDMLTLGHTCVQSMVAWTLVLLCTDQAVYHSA